MSEYIFPVQKEGWLQKQGGRHKNWKKRYFTLTNTNDVDDVLTYYEKDTKEKKVEKGTISLKDTSVRVTSPENAKDKNFCFEVYGRSGTLTSKHDTYVMCAIDSIEQDEWIAAIKHASEAASGDLKCFGVFLSDVVRRENSGNPIPTIVEKCVKFIEANGMEADGIYRTAGKASDVQHIKTLFDRGEVDDLGTRTQEPHVVAAVLKLYLRELPEPLCTFDRYTEFTKVASSNDDSATKAATLRSIVNFLPPGNRATLQRLMKHVKDISNLSQKNNMNLDSLASVFGPNVLKDRSESAMSMVTNTQSVTAAVKLMVELFDEVFLGQGNLASATTPAPSLAPAPGLAPPPGTAPPPPTAAPGGAPAPPPPAGALAGYPGGGGAAPAPAPNAYADIPSFYKAPAGGAPAPPPPVGGAPPPPPAATGPNPADAAKLKELEAKVKDLETKLSASETKASELATKLDSEKKARNWLEKTFEKELKVIRAQHGM